MTSKQQSPRQSQNSSPLPAQSATWPLILSNISFNGHETELLKNLRRNYEGIEKVSKLFLQDNEGRSIDAIRIELKSDNLARQFLEKKDILINNDKYSIKSSTRSLIVFNGAVGDSKVKLLQDLGHNYLGIENISRFHNVNNRPVNDIRIDFKSDSFSKKILTNNFILIDGKRRTVQPYYSLIYQPNQNEEDRASENSQKSAVEQTQTPMNKQPQNYLTERRLKELFQNHQMQLKAMINEFENRWNARLSTLTTSSTNTNVDQLLPILKDLTAVCQQFSQQNAHIQRQLGSVVNRVQEVQIKLNNEQNCPQTPVQNGH